MIQMQTRLAVADNTGAKELMCIKVLGGTHRRFAGLGDIIVCSIKSVMPASDFKKGAVVKATASKGENLLRTMLAMDPGAKRLGEFAFGTNYGVKNYTKNTLFDEKIGGTIHLAVGSGYPETGSKNKSSLHWDMVCDLRKNGEVYADDELIYKNGRFLNL